MCMGLVVWHQTEFRRVPASVLKPLILELLNFVPAVSGPCSSVPAVNGSTLGSSELQIFKNTWRS